MLLRLLVLLFCVSLAGPAAAQWSGYRTYYVPAYGPLYSGPLVDVRGAWSNRAPQFTVGFRGPIVGVNSPALRPGVRLAGVRGVPRTAPAPRAVTPAPAAPAQPDFYLEPRSEPRAEPDPAEPQLIRSFERVMEDRPLVAGTVERVGATGILVRYERDGEVVSTAFPHDRVFFFHEERLASGTSRPELLEPGLAVLVPLPEEQPASVAGAREERRIVRPAPPAPQPAPRRAAPVRRSPRRPAK